MTIQHYPEFPNFHVVKHPLVQHKLSHLRNKHTCKQVFKDLVEEITLLLGYEATTSLSLTKHHIETPLEPYDAPVLTGKKPVIIPILRAGLGMVDALLSLMPSARVGHIGLYRDEKTHEPHSYYFKIPPNSQDRPVFVCDPMLATGGTATAALTQLKQKGVKNLVFICIVASPQGVKTLIEAHPDVPIYAASLDRELNQNAYILPGLGDAGDRLFGTK